MDSVRIEPLTDSTSAEVIELLARAYLTNPIHVAMFGGSEGKGLQSGRDLFRALIEFALRGEWYAAIVRNRIVGVIHMVRFPRCRLSRGQRHAIAPRFAESVAEEATRIAKWGAGWAERDPDTDHWYLGPITALPEFQKGVSVV